MDVDIQFLLDSLTSAAQERQEHLLGYAHRLLQVVDLVTKSLNGNDSHRMVDLKSLKITLQDLVVMTKTPTWLRVVLADIVLNYEDIDKRMMAILNQITRILHSSDSDNLAPFTITSCAAVLRQRVLADDTDTYVKDIQLSMLDSAVKRSNSSVISPYGRHWLRVPLLEMMHVQRVSGRHDLPLFNLKHEIRGTRGMILYEFDGVSSMDMYIFHVLLLTSTRVSCQVTPELNGFVREIVMIDGIQRYFAGLIFEEIDNTLCDSRLVTIQMCDEFVSKVNEFFERAHSDNWLSSVTECRVPNVMIAVDRILTSVSSESIIVTKSGCCWLTIPKRLTNTKVMTVDAVRRSCKSFRDHRLPMLRIQLELYATPNAEVTSKPVAQNPSLSDTVEPVKQPEPKTIGLNEPKTPDSKPIRAASEPAKPAVKRKSHKRQQSLVDDVIIHVPLLKKRSIVDHRIKNTVKPTDKHIETSDDDNTAHIPIIENLDDLHCVLGDDSATISKKVGYCSLYARKCITPHDFHQDLFDVLKEVAKLTEKMTSNNVERLQNEAFHQLLTKTLRVFYDHVYDYSIVVNSEGVASQQLKMHDDGMIRPLHVPILIDGTVVCEGTDIMEAISLVLTIIRNVVHHTTYSNSCRSLITSMLLPQLVTIASIWPTLPRYTEIDRLFVQCIDRGVLNPACLLDGLLSNSVWKALGDLFLNTCQTLQSRDGMKFERLNVLLDVAAKQGFRRITVEQLSVIESLTKSV